MLIVIEKDVVITTNLTNPKSASGLKEIEMINEYFFKYEKKQYKAWKIEINKKVLKFGKKVDLVRTKFQKVVT